MKSTYDSSDLKPIPEYLKNKLWHVAAGQHTAPAQNEEDVYRDAISGKLKLETIIVIVDFLKDEYRRNRKYVVWHRVERCSLIQEQINRYLFEHNDMCRDEAEKIADNKGIELTAAYGLLEKKVRNNFLAQYRRRMRIPEGWDKKRKELMRDRFSYRIERNYDMPYPWNNWDDRNMVVQTYLFDQNGELAFISGGSGSSGQREWHSRYGILFARCQNKGIDIPTHVFVYNNQNRFRYLMTSKSLILSARDLGSNYSIDHNEEKKILKNIRLLNVDTGMFSKEKELKLKIAVNKHKAS